MLATIEQFGDALAEFVVSKVTLKLEAAGARFQEKTAEVTEQLRTLREVRGEIIAAKAKGNFARAEELSRELERLKAWSETVQRAASEVGA